MRQLPRWITRNVAVSILVLGVVLVLLWWLAYGERIVGAICADDWTSSSGNPGRCSGHGGVATDIETDTFVGLQTPGWVDATRWPALALGFAGTVTGLFGLGAALLRGPQAASTPKLGQRAPRKAGLKPIEELGLLEGAHYDLTVQITARDSGYSVEMTTPLLRGLRSLHVGDLPVDRGIGQLTELVANATTRGFGSKKAKAVESFGTALFDSIFNGAIEKAYRDSVDFVRQHNGALRISLQVDEQFADIPWEYLFDKHRGTFLALSKDTSLFRRIETTHATRSQQPIPCLRILAMCASPKHLATLDVQAEQARIKLALEPAIAAGHAQLNFVHGGNMAALNNALRDVQPHIFHFAGHGEWDEDVDDGVLFFEDNQGFRQPVTGRELGALLNGPNLRLAIFNSCNAARPSKEDRFAGIASSLIAQGVPAAIGMQFNFDDKAAVTFGSALLAGLADGVPIDAALTDARMAVLTLPNDLEWGTPVLTTRVPLDHVLPRSASA